MSELHSLSGEHEHLLQLLLEHVRDHAVFEVDEGGTVTSWNRSVFRVFGYSEAEILNFNIAAIFPAEQRSPERIHEFFATARESGKFEGNLVFQRKTGARFNAHIVIIPVQHSQPQRFVVVIRDLAVLMATQDQLHGLATLDQLTGLANRQHMFDLGRVEYRRWRRYRVPMSMILCDVDHLRTINEKHGIEAGDSLLRDVSDLLRQSVREVDMVARLEGGMFCALLFSTPLEGACVLAERIRAVIGNTSFSFHGHIIRASASLSVTTANEGALDFDDFYKYTEAALLHVKKQGGDRLVVA